MVRVFQHKWWTVQSGIDTATARHGTVRFRYGYGTATARQPVLSVMTLIKRAAEMKRILFTLAESRIET